MSNSNFKIVLSCVSCFGLDFPILHFVMILLWSTLLMRLFIYSFINCFVECNQPILPADSSVKTIRARYKSGANINITCNNAFVSYVWICNKDGLWRGPVASCPDPQPPNGGAAEGMYSLLLNKITFFVWIYIPFIYLYFCLHFYEMLLSCFIFFMKAISILFCQCNANTCTLLFTSIFSFVLLMFLFE